MKFFEITRYLIIIAVVGFLPLQLFAGGESLRFWEVQSVDTMKFSRDVAREKLNDYSFNWTIDWQVRVIAETGATHVAIGTAYDAEFLPFMKRWVAAARKYGLNVWFRGNWSGWEGWFEYPIISRADHLVLTERFILNNPDLFEDGDIFTACPECENGGPGDPRHNGDVKGHRNFLVNQYEIAQKAFKKIGKDVRVGYFSMNGDVARLIMDEKTTKNLGGTVTIDHYVRTAEKLADDIKDYIKKSGGRIVLGEFGAPIPDIHGRLTLAQQAVWIENALDFIVRIEGVEGINYWTNIGSSTQLWNERGVPAPAVAVIKSFFNPPVMTGFVKNESDKPVVGASVRNNYRTAKTDVNGYFELPYLKKDKEVRLILSADGYLNKLLNVSPSEKIELVLEKEDKIFFHRLLSLIKIIFSF